MGNALTRSRKKVDAEIMYEMRRQGMTNKQIAENLGVAISTVYTNIGRMSEAVKHAEVQNKPPVIDRPVDDKLVKTEPEMLKIMADEKPASAEKPPFRPCSVRTAEEKAAKEKPQLLKLEFAQYTMRGSLCQYVVDTSDLSVELMNGVVTGLLDDETIGRFIDELAQVRDMLKEGKVSA